MENDSSSTPAMIEVHLKIINQDKITVRIPENILVSDLKKKISEEINVSGDRQRLIYHGKVLKNSKSIVDYGIKDGNTIHLVYRREDTHVPTSSETTTTSAAPAPSTTPSSSDNVTAPTNAQVHVQDLGNGMVLGQINVETESIDQVNQLVGRVLQGIGVNIRSLQQENAVIQGATLSSDPNVTSTPLDFVPASHLQASNNNNSNMFQGIPSPNDISSTNTLHNTNTSIGSHTYSPTQVHPQVVHFFRQANTIRQNLANISLEHPTPTQLNGVEVLGESLREVYSIFHLAEARLLALSNFLLRERSLSPEERIYTQQLAHQLAPSLLQTGSLCSQIGMHLLQLQLGNASGQASGIFGAPITTQARVVTSVTPTAATATADASRSRVATVVVPNSTVASGLPSQNSTTRTSTTAPQVLNTTAMGGGDTNVNPLGAVLQFMNLLVSGQNQNETTSVSSTVSTTPTPTQTSTADQPNSSSNIQSCNPTLNAPDSSTTSSNVPDSSTTSSNVPDSSTTSSNVPDTSTTSSNVPDSSTSLSNASISSTISSTVESWNSHQDPMQLDTPVHFQMQLNPDINVDLQIDNSVSQSNPLEIRFLRPFQQLMDKICDHLKLFIDTTTDSTEDRIHVEALSGLQEPLSTMLNSMFLLFRGEDIARAEESWCKAVVDDILEGYVKGAAVENLSQGKSILNYEATVNRLAQLLDIIFSRGTNMASFEEEISSWLHETLKELVIWLRESTVDGSDTVDPVIKRFFGEIFKQHFIRSNIPLQFVGTYTQYFGEMALASASPPAVPSIHHG